MTFYPELDLFPDKKTARRSLARATQIHDLICLALMLVAGAVIAATIILRGGRFMLPREVYLGAGSLVGIGFPFLSRLLGREYARRRLRRDLVGMQVQICVPCGYDLSGSPTVERCPECGAPGEEKEKKRCQDDLIDRSGCPGNEANFCISAPVEPLVIPNNSHRVRRRSRNVILI